MDLNQNGFVSRAEIMEYFRHHDCGEISRLFNRTDVNKDGMISFEGIYIYMYIFYFICKVSEEIIYF